jgi:excisionase family DNA binding protein
MLWRALALRRREWELRHDRICWSRWPALGQCLVDFLLASTCHLLVELSKLGNPKSRKTKPDGFQMSEVESEILTLEEVAAYLKAGKRTVYRLAQKGEIPAFKLGGTWRFRRSELDRWIAESINKKKPEAE